MKVSIKAKQKPRFIPYRLTDIGLEIALSKGKLPVGKQYSVSEDLTEISNKSYSGVMMPKLDTQIVRQNRELEVSKSNVYPIRVDATNVEFAPLYEIADSLSTSDLNIISKFLDRVMESDSKVMEGQVHRFQNISILLHSLGSNNYRIEWISKMTGSSTSLAKISPTKWTVIRKWASIKNMNDISQVFDSRKSALYHFLANTDIIKSPDNQVDDAKQKCIELFLELEGIKADLKKKRLPKFRLQGAIGKIVEIRSKQNKDRVIGKGILMQLIGNEAEIKLTERIDIQSRSDFYKVDMKRVWL